MFGSLQTPVPGQSSIRPIYSAELYAIYLDKDHWGKGLAQSGKSTIPLFQLPVVDPGHLHQEFGTRLGQLFDADPTLTCPHPGTRYRVYVRQTARPAGTRGAGQ